jgi:tRNA (mo5U34)-methyltransferase
VTLNAQVDHLSLEDRVASVASWYHTLDLAPGVTTPGFFDLRPIADQLPWPDVAGKRVLDVGTFDGFFAFEMERRGATEIVAVDLGDHRKLDWPPDFRDQAVAAMGESGWEVPGTGFHLAAEALESVANWRPMSIYDLNPKELGQFDVVTVGSLLLHLRDPVRALEAVRSVTRPDGVIMSSEPIDLRLNMLARRRPLFTLNGSGSRCQWWNFNAAGRERLLFAAGFDVKERSQPYLIRFGVHPNLSRPPTRAEQLQRIGTRVVMGTSDRGLVHQAVVASPRLYGSRPERGLTLAR